MRTAVVVLAASSLLSTAPPALAAQKTPCRFYGLDVGTPVDAGSVILDTALAEQLASAGAGAVRIEFRLQDADRWTDAEIDRYDAILDAARGAGLEPLGVITFSAARGGQASWNDDPDGDGRNDYVERFATAAETLISKFAGRVPRWEIWSRPNCITNPNHERDPRNAGCTYILPRVLARILGEIRVRHEALFNVDEVSLVTGGLFDLEDGAAQAPIVDYLNELYDQPVWDELEQRYGRRYPWAALGLQLFLDQYTEVATASIAGSLDAARDVAAEHGDNSSFLVTGIGWTSLLTGENLQAANLATSFNYLSQRDDVAGAYWYTYRDDPLADAYYGLVTETGAPKPSRSALRDVAAGCDRDAPGGSSSASSGGGSSSGGGGRPPPTTGGTVGRPIGGPRRESSCTIAAGAPLGASTPLEASWLAALTGAAILRSAARRRTRRIL